ncbi:hypothetical protein HA402_009505 [Bradysia odoriphaga]|nr:hypothetical protein HA402_009505 [Bradysia odoriphaga]
MEEHNFKLIPILRYISLILLFLAATAQSGAADLIPNYDNEQYKLKVFDETKTKPLILSCNITTPGKHTLSWLRNNQDVSLDPQLKGRYEIIDVENKFIISNPKEEDAGKFTCRLADTGEEKEFNVAAKMYFKQLNHNQAVVEGEKMKLHCIAYGTEPEIKWVIENEVYEESRGRIRLTPDERNIKNAFLFIDQVELDDRKTYNCTGTNVAIKHGNANYTEAQEYIYVRVKGKLAALWPFLGICAEVFVLCAIILIYEKRRNKAELDESDTDQSPEQKNDHRGKETEIRQRK